MNNTLKGWGARSHLSGHHKGYHIGVMQSIALGVKSYLTELPELLGRFK